MALLKPLTCFFCERFFDSPESRRRHVVRHNIKYRYARIHRRHRMALLERTKKKTHSDLTKVRNQSERRHQCEYCQKCFTRKSTLTNHSRIHSKDKLYQCEYCQKCFTQKCTLTKHIRIHTKEKPYQCEYCQKCFTEKGNLTKHIRIHTKEKPLSV